MSSYLCRWCSQRLYKRGGKPLEGKAFLNLVFDLYKMFQMVSQPVTCGVFSRNAEYFRLQFPGYWTHHWPFFCHIFLLCNSLCGGSDAAAWISTKPYLKFMSTFKGSLKNIKCQAEIQRERLLEYLHFYETEQRWDFELRLRLCYKHVLS